MLPEQLLEGDGVYGGTIRLKEKEREREIVLLDIVLAIQILAPAVLSAGGGDAKFREGEIR